MKSIPKYIEKNIKKWNLDSEEAEEYRLIETTDFEEVPLAEKKRLIQLTHDAAVETMRLKRLNVNFRLQTDVLDTIKAKAAEKGLPYQTLISLILHEYAKGKITVSI